uniref:Relaxin family peptide/INSL5 receptor 4 n=1 Tax=Varanus komodoensis TaxID=61221 RepID=A0A8D2KTG9_VARKO
MAASGPAGNQSSVDPGLWNGSSVAGFDLGDSGGLVPSEVSFGTRTFVAAVYVVVGVVGLLGNALVVRLIWARRGSPTSAVNVLVFGLAVADFQVSLTLPFWAVEVALDFHWPFGRLLCKAIPFVTVLNVHANIFLLTAVSVARYWSVASALKDGARMTPRVARGITVALWAVALGATLPTLIYATLVEVAGLSLCLIQFPTTFRLGIYQLQRVVFTFAVPLAIILTSYLLLLRFLRTRHLGDGCARRRRRVSSIVHLLVSCFFVCWVPNQVVTFWGILVKFQALPLSRAFYLLHTYVFPFTICLAHANSCLNPILYCLMRREFRDAMKETFRKLSPVTSPKLGGDLEGVAAAQQPEHPHAGSPAPSSPPGERLCRCVQSQPLFRNPP